ncbi:MAG: hypothetical protein JO332_10720, partial [Planctomycetaceae bacterium]|nr:hypothetical protein [Planctomycetaceae bacterium]
MTLALETVAASSPLDQPESIAQLIRPVLPPATVADKPDPKGVWLREFLQLFEKELPILHSPDRCPTADLLRCAARFEASALRAGEAGSFAGFRASVNVADALCAARVALLSSGRDDDELEQVVQEWQKSLGARETFMSRGPAPADEVERYRQGGLAPRSAALKKSKERLESRSRLGKDLEAWGARARKALEDPATMTRPAALRSLAQEGAGLEGSGAWTEISRERRADALFLRGLLELVLGFLEGTPADKLREGSGALFRAARGLDPEAGKPWQGRLSPKIEAWLNAIPR